MAWDDFVQALALVDPQNFDKARIIEDAKREHEAELSIREAKIRDLEAESNKKLAEKDAEMSQLKVDFYNRLMKAPADPTGNPAAKGSTTPTGGGDDDEVVEATFDSLRKKG